MRRSADMDTKILLALTVALASCSARPQTYALQVVGSPSPSGCVGGDRVPIEAGYCVLNGSYTADAGAAACAALGGRLAVIETAEEDQALRAGLGPRFEALRAWIDLDDRGTEGQWRRRDGSLASYTAWGAGEPNDLYGEDCGEIVLPGGLWNDVPCDLPRATLCELGPPRAR